MQPYYFFLLTRPRVVMSLAAVRIQVAAQQSAYSVRLTLRCQFHSPYCTSLLVVFLCIRFACCAHFFCWSCFCFVCCVLVSVAVGVHAAAQQPVDEVLVSDGAVRDEGCQGLHVRQYYEERGRTGPGPSHRHREARTNLHQGAFL